MKSDKRIGAVAKGIEILEFLSGQREPVSIQEIGRALDIPCGTVRCYLATFRDSGFVDQNGDGYELGQRIALIWARRRALLLRKRDRCNAELKELGDE